MLRVSGLGSSLFAGFWHTSRPQLLLHRAEDDFLYTCEDILCVNVYIYLVSFYNKE